MLQQIVIIAIWQVWRWMWQMLIGDDWFVCGRQSLVTCP